MNSKLKITLFSDFCMNGISMDSNGATKEYYYPILGKYNFYQSFNERPSFKHAEYNYYIFWAYWAPSYTWMVCNSQ